MKESLDKLKDRPNEEKTAVAGGIAIMVMAILFAGWGFYVLKNVVRGGPVETSFGVRQDVVQSPALDQAALEFMQNYNDASDELRAIRDQAAQQQYNTTYDQERGLDGGSSFIAPQEEAPGFGL